MNRRGFLTCLAGGAAAVVGGKAVLDRVQDMHVGDTMLEGKIYPWQETFLKSLYETNAERTIVAMGRKHAKSYYGGLQWRQEQKNIWLRKIVDGA